jgi:hypothetical protein
MLYPFQEGKAYKLLTPGPWRGHVAYNYIDRVLASRISPAIEKGDQGKVVFRV